MHRYRIIAQIYLILSILNLVLAAPVVVQRTHGTSSDNLPDVPDLEMGPAEDVAPIPNGSGELEPAPDRSVSPAPSSPNAMTSPKHSLDESMSPPSSPNAPASPQHSLDGSMSPPSSPNAPASPQHSLDGSISPHSSPNTLASPQYSLDRSTDSGYPDPYLEEGSSASGYSWMLERPPRTNLYDPLPKEPAGSPTWAKLGKVLASFGALAGGIYGLGKLKPRDCQDCQL
jgi:hypothetical protein